MDLVRSGVAVADAITADLQVAVLHRPRTGSDGFGPTFGAPVARQALWEPIARRFRASDGTETFSRGRLTLPRAVTVTREDEFTLPDGTVGRILEVRSLPDSAGGDVLTEVWLG